MRSYNNSGHKAEARVDGESREKRDLKDALPNCRMQTATIKTEVACWKEQSYKREI